MLLRSNLISKFKSSLLTIPLSWLAERTFENSNRLFRSLIISKSCLYEYSFPWISEYNFSIIADPQATKSLIKGIAHKVSKQGKPNIRLSECLLCTSSTLQESDVAEVGAYPVYGANGIVGYLDTYNTTSEAIYIIKDGSGVGAVSCVKGKCSATGTLNILQTKEGFSLRYLYFILKVFSFEPYKTGMAIPHIYFKDYGKAKIYCPSNQLQCKYADLLSKIEQKATAEQKILDNLCSQKQYLLCQMFI